MELIKKIVRFCKKKCINKKIDEKLRTLSPTENAENIDTYLTSLQWALYNSKSVKNIAISGPYGAGKSSIIDTYIKKNKFNHKYLKVSLATFQDIISEKLDLDNEEKFKEKNRLERLIELSLLQQFFYHEKDSKIPDSKFQKTKKKSKAGIIVYLIFIALFVLSFTFTFSNNAVSDFIKTYIPFYELLEKLFSLKFWIPIALKIYIILFLGCCIYKFIKLFSKISTVKLAGNHAEIEIGNEISKSALNTYLDEILYFFEVSKYEVVFIEDLDRFEQSEIFVKLRELNQLINNSKKIKQDVVFVYAIKDDMFMNKERTKFFDFIIPVIPVINNSNSKDKLTTILNKSKTKISEDLISDISFFIDDMRILNNILNEFYLYEKILAKTDLNADNLLAIITYKNLFPNDFVLLMQNKGDLYEAINRKDKYLENRRDEINSEIQLLQKKIEDSDRLLQQNLKELRLLYISVVAEYVMQHGGRNFTDESKKSITFNQLSENDEYFKFLKQDKLSYYFPNYSRYYPIELKFSEIENTIDSQESYDEKEEKLRIKLNPTELYKNIEELKNKREKLQKRKLKDLILDGEINVFDETNEHQFDCIDRLLRNGYIDENYLDYISIFHEGSLKKADYDFLLKFKRNESCPFEYKLYKTDELIKQINLYDFEKENILNFYLVETLISSTKETDKKNIFYKQFSNATVTKIDFLNKFIDKTSYLELFIKELCSNCTCIWNILKTTSILSAEERRKWFEYIIKYADIKDISKIFKKNDEYFSHFEDYFFISTDSERLKEIISILDIKFAIINKNTSEEHLYYLLEQSLFEINKSMLTLLLSNKISLTKEFYSSNYNFICSSEIDPLKKYIYENINTYIQNVYLRLEDNREETEGSLIELLNNQNLKLELKNKIIQKENTIIKDVSNIKEIKVQNLLFDNKKVAISWENIYQNYVLNGSSFSDNIIEYLSTRDIAEELSEVKLSTRKGENGISIYSNLNNSIINEKRVDDGIYRLLTKSSPWWYSVFDTEKVTPERISILIQNGVVAPTIETFDFLRLNYAGKQIELFEKYNDKFIDNLEALKLSVQEVEEIIRRTVLNQKIKYSCIKQLSESEIKDSVDILQYLLSSFDKSDFDFSDKIKKEMLSNEKLNKLSKILFFQSNYSILKNDEIDIFLKSLGENYFQITDKHKRPSVLISKENKILLSVLKEIGYISSFKEIDNSYRIFHKSISHV
ncbi:MAG: hypothetical protein E7060_01440 [Treponema bryantii]|nr:hypothetical protein [Treponema bryantii]